MADVNQHEDGSSTKFPQSRGSVFHKKFQLLFAFLKDASLRSAFVHLMTNSSFHRLMPEAYSESMEILREIERARPDWLRDAPDLRFFNRWPLAGSAAGLRVDRSDPVGALATAMGAADRRAQRSVPLDRPLARSDRA